MKVLIIGSGLIGVTSAYVLQRSGHRVTVIDKEMGSGLKASFANGALLTPSMAEPWNSPGSWRVLVNSLGRSDAALQLRLRTLPSLIGWGRCFVRNSVPAAFERNAQSNLRLALYSLQVMKIISERTLLDFAHAEYGSLRIFRDPVSLAKASASVERHRASGLPCRVLSRAETIDLEPALTPIAHKLAGSVHYETDQTGDAYRFCVGLTKYAQRDGVEFRFNTEVSSLEMCTEGIKGVRCGNERLTADAYIVAAGSYSPRLLKQAGIQIPVRPVKGYSVTFGPTQQTCLLRTPVVDDQLHAVVVPVGPLLRAAGTAEFAGYDHSLRTDRVRNLLKLAQEILPDEALDFENARSWCGLRPMSADGVPIIGGTAIPNLLVNVGHGHLGWTMAAGSAQMLADLVNGKSPPLDPTAYSLSRFGRTA
jgi:D-amino-acid dehydrogenase